MSASNVEPVHHRRQNPVKRLVQQLALEAGSFSRDTWEGVKQPDIVVLSLIPFMVLMLGLVLSLDAS